MRHGFHDPQAALLEPPHTCRHVYCFARRGIMLKACRFMKRRVVGQAGRIRRD
jgi:hypothetical protein